MNSEVVFRGRVALLKVALGRFLPKVIFALGCVLLLSAESFGQVVYNRSFYTNLSGAPINGVQFNGYSRDDYESIGSDIERDSLEFSVLDVNLPADSEIEVLLDDNLIGTIRTANNTTGVSWIYQSLERYPGEPPFGIEEGTTLKLKYQGNTIAEGLYTEILPESPPRRDFFRASMSGAKVIPAVQTTGNGYARAFLNTFYGNRSIVEYAGFFYNLSSPVTSVTLHGPATVGQNAPILATFSPGGVTIPNCQGVCGGFFSNGRQITEQQADSLRQGLFYIVVRTVNFPNGEIRTNLIPSAPPGDYQGDGRADYSVFRPSNSRWYIRDSATEGYSEAAFGTSQDKLVPADYDGDGKTDTAIYRPVGEQGYWYINLSESGTVYTMNWGLASDVPVRGDFNGDRRDDLTVYRASSGTWYTLFSDVIKPVAPDESNWRATQWGMAGDIPVAADFNRDGITDHAVYRPSQGNWYIRDAMLPSGYRAFNWGLSTDIPLVGDFNGDTRFDLVVFRPSEGNWYIYDLATSSYRVENFGLASDVPVPADYDGDGKTDVAVFRDGMWYVKKSRNGSVYGYQFGTAGDVPTTGRP